MQSDMWDTLTNLVLLLFWFRIWMTEDRDLVFNRFLSPVGRLSGSVIGFLKPVFFRTPPRVIAAVCLVFLLVFRGMLVSSGMPWILRFGFVFGRAYPGDAVVSIAFSFLSFARFVFRLWGLAIIFVRGTSAASDQATGTLHALARPFTDVRMDLRPFVLLGAGMFIAVAAALAGSHQLDGAHPFVAVVFCARSALKEWVDLLPLIGGILILLIIGSWVGIFTHSGGMLFFCREWLQVFLGPFRRYPLRIGMIDLTPIVVIFLLRAIHWLLDKILTGGLGAF